MLNNYSLAVSPTVKKFWKCLSDQERLELVYKELMKNGNIKNIKIFKIYEDGQIILKIEELIKSSDRGIYLLDIEAQLKKNIDEGLTVWLEPVGDKSKLRNLRGVTFKSK